MPGRKAAASMASDVNVTVIGRSATFRGDITGEGDVQIEGTLEGTVALTNARISVGPQARVKANLNAQEIIVQGFVEGELRTTGRAELRSTATVVGNVYAARFSVEDEATIQGRIELTPAAQKASAAPGSAGAAGSTPADTSSARAAGNDASGGANSAKVS
jgi:cytoskeletal protein CcmA (bactofilin family)